MVNMLPDRQTWWTEDRIQAAVTAEYIVEQFGPETSDLLKQSISFGDGLTDHTYLDYILEHAKRLFLILRHIGIPEQIFGLIDESYDDEDLPITSQALKDLRLSPNADSSLDRKFYKAQFKYLVRDIKPGRHVYYLDEETVPVTIVGSASGLGRSAKDGFEKVQLASRVAHIYGRKRLVLEQPPNHLTEAEVLSEINYAKRLANEHVLSIYGSYSEGSNIYILLTPAIEYTLHSFVNSPPKNFENLPKSQRRETVLNWPHCLANGLAWLHSNHRHHGALRPSNILVDNAYRIYLGQIDGLAITHGNVKVSDIESYQYAAPERWKRAATMQTKSPAMLTMHSGSRTARKPNSSTRDSLGSGSDPHEGATSTAASLSPTFPIDVSTPTSTTYPFIPTSKGSFPRGQVRRPTDGFEYAASLLSSHSSGTPQDRSYASQLPRNQPGNPSRRRSASCASGAQTALSSHSSDRGQNDYAGTSRSVTVAPTEVRSAVVQTWQSAQFDPHAADIFSLGAIILDIITFLCKRSSAAFSRHRSAKNRMAGRGGGVADASFHANLGQVFAWTVSLEEDAKRKASKDDGRAFQAVGHIIEVARGCLTRAPEDRPEALLVEKSLDSCIQEFTSSGTAHCRFGTHPHDEQPKTAGKSGSDSRSPSRHLRTAMSSADKGTGAREKILTPRKAAWHSAGWGPDPHASEKLDLAESPVISSDLHYSREQADRQDGVAMLNCDLSEKPRCADAYQNDDTVDLHSITNRTDRIRNGSDIPSSINAHTDPQSSYMPSNTQPSSTTEAQLMESVSHPISPPPSLLPQKVRQPQLSGALSPQPVAPSLVSHKLRKLVTPETAQIEQEMADPASARQRDREIGPHIRSEQSDKASRTDSVRAKQSGGNISYESRGRLSVSTLASNTSTIHLSWQERDVSPMSAHDTDKTPNASSSMLTSARLTDVANAEEGDFRTRAYSNDGEKEDMHLGRTQDLSSLEGMGRYWHRNRESVSDGANEGKGRKSSERAGSKRAWFQARYPIVGGRIRESHVGH